MATKKRQNDDDEHLEKLKKERDEFLMANQELKKELKEMKKKIIREKSGQAFKMRLVEESQRKEI